MIRASVKAEFLLVTLALELAYLRVKPEQMELTHDGIINYIKERGFISKFADKLREKFTYEDEKTYKHLS